MTLKAGSNSRAFECALFSFVCSLLLEVQFLFEDLKNKVWKLILHLYDVTLLCCDLVCLFIFHCNVS